MSKAKIHYVVNDYFIGTSCEGGDSISFGQVDLKRSQLFDENQDLIPFTPIVIDELETVFRAAGVSSKGTYFIEDNKVNFSFGSDK